jgi:AGZA family xanthine/uracil permease-like MFS transporter
MSKDNSQLSAIAEFFEFEKHGSDTKTEVLAGVTTFVTLAYSIVVNPAILSQAIEVQGHSQQEVIQMLAVITILAGFVGTLVMALYAKRPFGLAPGM